MFHCFGASGLESRDVSWPSGAVRSRRAHSGSPDLFDGKPKTRELNELQKGHVGMIAFFESIPGIKNDMTAFGDHGIIERGMVSENRH